MSSASSSAVLTRRIAAWHLCLAAAPIVIAAYYALVRLDVSPGTQMALYVSANAVSALCCLYAARRHPVLRRAALFLAASSLVSVAADVIFYFQALVNDEVPYPGVADAFYLAAYPLMAVGLLLIIRRRTPGWDGASAIDAAIVAVGARLMLGAGPRSVSLRLIGGYLGLVLYPDTVYSIQTLNGTYQVANYLDALWIASGFLFAAAMLHPSAPKLVSESNAATPDATTGRLVILALAAMIAPTSILFQVANGREAQVVAAAAVCNVLFLLVLVRMTGLVRAQRLAAITDGLTGLRSRRYFEEALGNEGARAERHEQPLSMLLLDIDHFKHVNDTYGHNGGDRVLVEVTHRVQELIRPGDVVARYGGEEFAVLLPNTGPEQAWEIAERVRRGVGAAPIAVGPDRLSRVTVSVGIAGMPAAATTDELVLAADRALYAAKNAGRNRVAAADGADQLPASAAA
ncbi:GGDEF domain-containing protein [Actinoplanes sp. NBC_00393]|uniref:GGDEF domain-containing protein n=1 Tax=Actinoplanes sp. NBC_00393 TaxID=2975953 RepID=UPI002E1CC990